MLPALQEKLHQKNGKKKASPKEWKEESFTKRMERRKLHQKNGKKKASPKEGGGK